MTAVRTGPVARTPLRAAERLAKQRRRAMPNRRTDGRNASVSGALAAVLGTRPEIIKLAGVLRRLSPHARVVDTGQHFDAALSADLTAELGVVSPSAGLGVGGAAPRRQIRQATRLLDGLFVRERPRAVIVQGDTNSALAGALAASAAGLPLVHVEAGLRSFDRSMPEEHNRVLIDHLAHLCLAPTAENRRNLLAEAIPAERIVVTGNTVVDAVLELLPPASDRAVVRRRLGLQRDAYIVATIHRPENVDDRHTLTTVLRGLRTLPLPALLPLHPRTARRISEFGLECELRGLRVVAPMPYRTFVGLAAEAALLVSDSGGVQEEASVLKRPVLVVRRSTERPEVVGTYARLVRPGESLEESATPWLDDLAAVHAHLAGLPSPYGAGQASVASAGAIVHWLEQRRGSVMPRTTGR